MRIVRGPIGWILVIVGWSIAGIAFLVAFASLVAFLVLLCFFLDQCWQPTYVGCIHEAGRLDSSFFIAEGFGLAVCLLVGYVGMLIRAGGRRLRAV